MVAEPSRALSQAGLIEEGALAKSVKGAVAATVDAVELDADVLGRAVLMTLRAGQVPLGYFAIPPDPGLQMKAAEVSKTDTGLTEKRN